METVKFCEFKVLKKPRTLSKVLKIELEYRIKKFLGAVLGQQKTEQFGNAYTILVKKSDQAIKIF